MSEQHRSLDQITVPKPCNADWEAMKGNDQVRFCEHCNLHVTDLSTLTRSAAMRLVARSQGRLCVRYVQAPNGGVLTRQLPQKIHRISRRVSRFAASAFTATLSLSSAAAQTAAGSNPQSPPPAATRAIRPDELGATLSGKVTDPTGAVIRGATLTLTNTQTHIGFSFTTGDDGAYKFALLENGVYSITAEAPSFVKTEMSDLELRAGAGQTINLSMDTPPIQSAIETVGEKTRTIALGGAMVMRAPEEPLVKAAFEDDLAAVKVLVLTSSNVDLNDTNTNMNALAYAAEHGNREMIQALLAAGADPNARNERGETALMHLRGKATVDIVHDLISAGADVNARDEYGDTPLLRIANSTSLEVINELIAAGAAMNAKNNEGVTALMNAAENNDPEVAMLFIKAGAEVLAKTSDDQTALMVAARWGSEVTVKSLLDARSEVDAKNSDGKTALLLAAENDNPAVVRLLINGGADVNAKDEEGNSALMIAAEEGKEEMVKMLIEQGAEINARDGDGQTALIRADLSTSIILLNAGADPNLKDKEGETALSLARRSEAPELIKLLVSRGARE